MGFSKVFVGIGKQELQVKDFVPVYFVQDTFLFVS